MSDYNEDHYEQTLIELFTERLEYNYLNGYDIQNGFEDKDYYCPLYLERLREKLKDINPSLPKSAIDEAERFPSRPSMRQNANCSTSKPAIWCRTTSFSWIICNMVWR